MENLKNAIERLENRMLQKSSKLKACIANIELRQRDLIDSLLRIPFNARAARIDECARKIERDSNLAKEYELEIETLEWAIHVIKTSGEGTA
jgi:hypothetical protein